MHKNQVLTNVIYALIDPRTMIPRYVGLCSRDSKKRQNEHRFDARNGTARTRRDHWLRKLHKLGLEPIFEILEECGPDEETLRKAEIFWIALLGRADHGTGVLTNGNDGGGGQLNPSPETRAKLSAAAKLHQKSPEHLEALRQSHTGKKQSQEARDKKSKALIGIKRSKEFCEAVGDRRRGQKASPETRAKISESSRQRKHSQVTLDKMSRTRTGRKHSQEHKDAIAAGHLRRSRMKQLREKAEAVVRELSIRVRLHRERLGLK